MDGPGSSFEEAALRQGLITPEQLDECRRVRDNVVAQGLECSVEEVILKKGFITKAQATGVYAALGRGNKNAIEGYEILAKLGSGGQGAVYKARQSSMDRIVAIKILAPKYAKDKDGLQRFLREARAIAKLNHPNIVSGIDAGYSNGIYYYVMEYVEGEGLDRRISRTGGLPWKEAVSVLRQVAAALDHAGRNDLVHRDIKPSNILLAKDGTAKLMDLGMVRFAGQDAMTLTQTGCVVGTPYYMAPEQARGEEKVDLRADLYSLGITLYEMLAGKPPYTGSDPLVVLNRHLKETVRFAFPDVPAELLAVGHRLTERDRARRYASPAQLLEDLEALEADQPLAHARSAVRPRTSRIERVQTRAEKSRAPLFVGIGAAALALVVGVAIALPGKKEPPAPPKETVRAVPPSPPPEARPKVDRGPLDAIAAARDYEIRNPNDLEEIVARYEALLPKAAGTAEAENVRRLAEKSRSALSDAIKRRKESVADELQVDLSGRKFGAALKVLEQHGRDYRSREWEEWIAAERAKVDASLRTEAQKLRDASAAAQAKGDLEGAKRPLVEMRELGVPALAAEGTQRLEALEKSRADLEAEAVRKARADQEKLAAFLDQADGWAGERAYEKIVAGVPALETAPARETLKASLARYRDAQEILQTALKHLLGLAGKPVQFRTRDGQSVAGTVEVVQERPLRILLAGGKAYDAAQMTGGSLAAFYRSSRGAPAPPEPLLLFAVLDGDAALAAEILAKKAVELPPRYQERLKKLAEEAKPAKTEVRPVAKKPEPAREIVVYAADLPKDALSEEFSFVDDPSSAGGRRATMANDGEIRDPPPETDGYVLFKVQVQAGVPYRCWLRMRVGKPKGKSQANLLFVQFTNSVDKAGKDAFTLGTKDVLALRGPAREGWVWVGRDLADPKSTEPHVYFRSAGEVTVRVSAGNDGVAFDQLVLSPARFLEKPPSDPVLPK